MNDPWLNLPPGPPLERDAEARRLLLEIAPCKPLSVPVIRFLSLPDNKNLNHLLHAIIIAFNYRDEITRTTSSWFSNSCGVYATGRPNFNSRRRDDGCDVPIHRLFFEMGSRNEPVLLVLNEGGLDFRHYIRFVGFAERTENPVVILVAGQGCTERAREGRGEGSILDDMSAARARLTEYEGRRPPGMQGPAIVPNTGMLTNGVTQDHNDGTSIKDSEMSDE